MLKGPVLHTTVYLIRNAQTAWNDERRLAGRRELGLSDQGRAAAASLAERFAGIALDELLVSPLPRSMETASALATAQGLDVARDPRLSDWQAGAWEGRGYADIMSDPAYRAMLDQPLTDCGFPGGERFVDIRERMLASIRQALEDNELGAHIALVSHAGPLRILLSHYLSLPPWDHERLRLEPCSVTVLQFTKIEDSPSLVAINLTGRILDSVGTAR